MYSVQYLRRTSNCSSPGYFTHMYSSKDISSMYSISDINWFVHWKKKIIEKNINPSTLFKFLECWTYFFYVLFFADSLQYCLSKSFALTNYIDYILALEFTMYIYTSSNYNEYYNVMCLYIYVLILTSVYFFLWQDCVLCLKLYKNRFPRISTSLLNKRINVSQITWWDLLWW